MIASMTDASEQTFEYTGSDDEMKPRRSDRGVNTFGDKIISHVDAINDAYDTCMKQTEDVRKYLVDTELSVQPAEWKNKRFGYITLRQYCRGLQSETLVPAEFGIAVFSLQEGIIDLHTGFLEVDDIPFAETGEVKLTCEINGYPSPKTNHNELVVKPISATKFVRMINALANKYGLVMNDETVFFSARSEISIINCCLNWIRSNLTMQDMIDIRFIPFEILLKEITTLTEDNPTGVIKTEGGAGKIIYHTRYDFCHSLGCEWHKRGSAAEKIDRCASNISLRRVYNCLYYLCHLFQRQIVPGSHCPFQEISFLKMPNAMELESEDKSSSLTISQGRRVIRF